MLIIVRWCKLALPSGIFQINEPILFGLPIIMNPVMFIPFVLVQTDSGGNHPQRTTWGIIPPVTNIAPWTMPTGLGAFFNTNGSVVGHCWLHSSTLVSQR